MAETDILLKILDKFDEMNGRFDELKTDVAEQFAHVNNRLDQMEIGQASIGRRLDRVETRLERIEGKLDATFDQVARLTESQTGTDLRCLKGL
ncbi:MAG: hypothetical protein LBU58_10570 [Clostridiales bacterium]|jgi:tetrahydromethanopterin S-methyltransferase subunit G|nr:hypothetical protein [Clostridiales bacterium]